MENMFAIYSLYLERMFVRLISHDRKYCWLICFERKTLINSCQIWLIS